MPQANLKKSITGTDAGKQKFATRKRVLKKGSDTEVVKAFGAKPGKK